MGFHAHHRRHVYSWRPLSNFWRFLLFGKLQGNRTRWVRPTPWSPQDKRWLPYSKKRIEKIHPTIICGHDVCHHSLWGLVLANLSRCQIRQLPNDILMYQQLRVLSVLVSAYVGWGGYPGTWRVGENPNPMSYLCFPNNRQVKRPKAIGDVSPRCSIRSLFQNDVSWVQPPNSQSTVSWF